MEKINIKYNEIDEQMIDELNSALKAGKDKEYLSRLDFYLAHVKTLECGEKLLFLKDSLPDSIFIDLVDLKIEAEGLYRNQLREGVVNRLIKAQNYLPEGLHLVIRDAFRSKQIVEKLYDRYISYFIEKEKLTNEEADIKVRSLLAMPDDIVPPGHMTGGAVDVILAYNDGSKVPMEVDEKILARQKQIWTECKELPEDIKKNRMILLDAMIEAGFHNYPKEYWHYSFGDAYWAVRRKEKVAIYGIPN